MWNGLPKLSQHTNQEERDSSKEKRQKQTLPEHSYRGITLKEYFRLREESKPNDTLKQIK